MKQQIYTIETLETLGEVAKECNDEQFDTLITELKMTLQQLRKLPNNKNIQMARLNWSPLDKFPEHLLDNTHVKDHEVAFIMERIDTAVKE